MFNNGIFFRYSYCFHVFKIWFVLLYYLFLQYLDRGQFSAALDTIEKQLSLDNTLGGLLGSMILHNMCTVSLQI